MLRCISWTLQVRISFCPRLKLEKVDEVSLCTYAELGKWTSDVRDVANGLMEGQPPSRSPFFLGENE